MPVLQVFICHNMYCNVEAGVCHELEGYGGIVSYVLALDGVAKKSRFISWS